MFTVPNIFTLLNLMSGCVALYGIFYESVWVVIIFFILALLFDFLDGFSARLLSQTSSIGKELDSLADLISFGVLPTFLFVDIVERSLEISEIPLYGLIFVLAAGAALRLASFNTDESGKDDFNGLPSPAMAMIAFSVWINIDNPHFPLLEGLSNPPLILILAIALTALMNIPIRFIKFSISSSVNINSILSFILIFIFLGGLFVNWRLSVMITTMAYFILSLLLPLFAKVSHSSV